MQLVLELKSQLCSLTTRHVRAGRAFGWTLHSPAKVPEMMCIPRFALLFAACLPHLSDSLTFEAGTSDLSPSRFLYQCNFHACAG